ncbi:MAG: translocated intimin receptor Tir [Terriglobia bacterium]
MKKAKAVLTDSHFWAPLVVLLLGIALLAYLH